MGLRGRLWLRWAVGLVCQQEAQRALFDLMAKENTLVEVRSRGL